MIADGAVAVARRPHRRRRRRAPSWPRVHRRRERARRRRAVVHARAGQRPPAPHRRPAGRARHPRRPRARRRRSSTGRCRPRRPHRRRRRAVGHARRSSRRSATASRSRSRPAPWPTPTGCSPALRRVGIGGTLGSWGWDVGDGPCAGPSTRCSTASGDLARRCPTGHERVEGWVTLVGHDLMSDELVAAPPASWPARHGTGIDVPPLAHRLPTPTSYLGAPGAGRWCTSTSSACSARTCCRPRRAPRRRRGRRRARTATSPSLLPVGLPAPRPGRDAAPGATPSSSSAAGGSRSAATPRTPATRRHPARRPLAAGLAKDTQGRPDPFGAHDRRSSWPRSAAPRRSAWATRSARSRSASGPTSW